MLGHPAGLEHNSEDVGKVIVIPTKVPVRKKLSDLCHVILTIRL